MEIVGIYIEFNVFFLIIGQELDMCWADFLSILGVDAWLYSGGCASGIKTQTWTGQKML